MIKILIVDDSAQTRTVLRLLLEDYTKDNNLEKFEISEAENGLEALNKCKKESYQLIFMDIEMPYMDGVQTTQEIRKTDSKTMIIAISGVNDKEQRELILSSGAEDYISKPLNRNIFLSRFTNYLALIDAREHAHKESISFKNLYTNEIYSRYTKFILNTEDAIAELWEFFLLNAKQKSNQLNDIVRTIINIAEMDMSRGSISFLYIEESEAKQYFTVSNIELLSVEEIESTLIKNGVREGYLLEKDKLSFELLKVSYKEELSVDTHSSSSMLNVSSKTKIEPIQEEAISSPLEFESSKALEVFDYMDEDDLYDLEEYAAKLNSIMLVVGNGGVTEEEVTEVYIHLDKIGSILSTYSEVFSISQALILLSQEMSSHVNEFIENSEALGPMCAAFSSDMSSWIEQSFHTGAPSVDFMNDTIVVNCQTIGGMLSMNDAAPASDDDFDDIFDF